MISGLILAPCVIGAVFAGPTVLFVLVAAAAGAMAWEWARMVGDTRLRLPAVVLVLSVITAVELSFVGLYGWSLAVTTLGVAAVFVAGGISNRRRRGRDGFVAMKGAATWTAVGAIYIGAPCAAFIWLAGGDAHGRDTALWLFGVVWATDIGAYAFGRLIGGPKLAPRVSPNKTWAGLLGGVSCAAGVGAAAAAWLDVGSAALLISVSGVLAVVAQLGDLAESAVKRRFGRKDSGNLIPGHGGLLDRLDGFLAASAGAALLTIAIGESVLSWR